MAIVEVILKKHLKERVVKGGREGEIGAQKGEVGRRKRKRSGGEKKVAGGNAVRVRRFQGDFLALQATGSLQMDI